MTVGLLTLDIRVPGSRSLKDKRRVVKSLKEQMRGRYNCSVAEVGFKDQWARAEVVVAVVGDDSRFVNTQLNEIARFASNKNGAELLDCRIEML